MYGDCQKMRSMIQDNTQGIQAPAEQIQCNLESLNSMVRPRMCLCVKRLQNMLRSGAS